MLLLGARMRLGGCQCAGLARTQETIKGGSRGDSGCRNFRAVGDGVFVYGHSGTLEAKGRIRVGFRWAGTVCQERQGGGRDTDGR